MQVARCNQRPLRSSAPRLRSTALRRTVVLVAASKRDDDAGLKVIHCMRHGVTEMNEYLTVHKHDAEGFKDPLMYDTVLTARGREGAQAAMKAAERLNPKPELLVVSPLTRALETAQLAFLPHYEGPVLVEPLVRERVWHASDIGSSREQLGATFPDGRYDFDSLPDVWWHCVDPADPRAVGLEPQAVFKARVLELRRWLAARPERCIALVAHWGLINELTDGAEFANCEVRSYGMDARVERRVAASGGAWTGPPPALRERVPGLLAALFR
ncbi:hypothetical protein TSOC_004130 [Tetrabaena socialis]|uniref:Uncharacterized protein n=1 Tax=Tetrabaena socialis TaxID=47790 RepID=A0A2J8A9R7_9CHLO|nr:hypothetical protein TSOC_004130 [Tetrabaena socialis]|eukprot:PNH09274.1 hypothetical protein TSOC_004130 [Tetrabaena socialis]